MIGAVKIREYGLGTGSKWQGFYALMLYLRVVGFDTCLVVIHRVVASAQVACGTVECGYHCMHSVQVQCECRAQEYGRSNNRDHPLIFFDLPSLCTFPSAG